MGCCTPWWVHRRGLSNFNWVVANITGGSCIICINSFYGFDILHDRCKIGGSVLFPC